MNGLLRFLFFLFSVVLVSCDSEIAWSDTYIGSYRKVDFKYSFPFILEKRNDSIRLLNTDGLQIDLCNYVSDSLLVNDTLEFKDFGYVIKYVDNDKHRIGIKDYRDTIKYKYWMHYAHMHRARDTPGIALNSIKEVLNEKIWLYDDLHPTPNRHFRIKNYLHFSNKVLTSIKEYWCQDHLVHSSYNKKKYKLYQLNEVILLNVSNQDNDDNSTIFQILNGSETKLNLVRFNSRYQEECFFKNADKDLSEFEKLLSSSRAFARCSDDYAGEYYLGQEMSYTKGNDFIRRKGNDELPISQENGYITFHFDLNCNNSIGNFGLEMMNLDYKEKQFPLPVVQHLFNTLLDLDDWPDIDHPYVEMEYEDVHGFIMFKFIDGHITDVLP